MTRTLLGGAIALLTAGNAAAHTGAHQQDVATQIAHWFASPVHSAGTFIAAALAIGAAVVLYRRRKS